ncbi:hypothetical protein I3843_15G152400 [Carya illinoinensis]|nr:hypothetical protein I3843_15G152400 [Carya illinoinensis]
MASSAGTDVVKAGYWFFEPDSLNRHEVKEIPSELFTHLYAGFAVVNSDTGEVTFPTKYQQEFQNFHITVRNRNPTVKALLSIGGPGPDISTAIASVARDEKLRDAFINSSIKLVRENHYDGLDLCWLYPASKADEENLASLLKKWRRDLDTEKPNKLLLTAAVFHHPGIPVKDSTFNYPIEAINENLDWINILAIDFYTNSNSTEETGPVHAWNTRQIDQQDRCGSVGIQKWIDVGVSISKLVLGLPFYGYEWILPYPNSPSGFFAPAHPATPPTLAYKDIQDELLRDTNYETVWIGYDDGLCVFGKVRKAIDLKLGGYFAWCVGADDIFWTLSRSDIARLPNSMTYCLNFVVLFACNEYICKLSFLKSKQLYCQ